MKKQGTFYMGLAAFIALIVLACAAGQKQYDYGMQLSAAGKYKDAIA